MGDPADARSEHSLPWQTVATIPWVGEVRVPEEHARPLHAARVEHKGVVGGLVALADAAVEEELPGRQLLEDRPLAGRGPVVALGLHGLKAQRPARPPRRG